MAFSRFAKKAFITLALTSTASSFTCRSYSSLLRIPFATASSATGNTCKAKMSTVAEAPTSQKTLEEQSEAYASLVAKLKAVTQLNRVSSVLGYDQLVFMPQADETATERGAQMSALASVIHEKSTEKDLLKLIQQAQKDLETLKEDYSDEARVLEIEEKSFVEKERIPSELVAKSAQLSAQAYGAWVKARKENDFKSLEPILKDCFDTAKEIADAKRGDKDIGSYTQMLDEYEVGMSEERIDEIFSQIQTALVPLIQKVMASTTPPSTDPLKGTFDVEKQKEMNKRIVKAIGFDEDHGRIDVSVHPFTTSFSPADVRITSRFSDKEWSQGLFGTIHEGGHAIYEQNLKPSALNIDTALSMGTHESQSLFWERHVGLSKPFWKWATPILQETFENFDYTPEQVYGAVNVVSKSLIRVEADELTYPLHVIMRYGIEKDVIEGNLEVKDMPQRWNEQMKKLLDVDVPSDTKGCLQDVHWPSMAIGYFPTYLIGSATAAQLAHYCKQDMPDFDSKVEAGEFQEIKEWLTAKVHTHGKRYKSLDALLEAQVGEKLNPKYFIDYLTSKYTDLYKVES